MEIQADEGSASFQGFSRSSDAAEFIEGLMKILYKILSSSKSSNPTDLDSNTSMDSAKRFQICLKEGLVTSACKLIINKADFVRKRNGNYAKNSEN